MTCPYQHTCVLELTHLIKNFSDITFTVKDMNDAIGYNPLPA
jgi:hypothetical protein